MFGRENGEFIERKRVNIVLIRGRGMRKIEGKE